MKKIVTIGGGTGHFNLLSALRDIDGIKISAVVSMVDSGGSTGRLRDELGVLPPGDILKCILALSPDRELERKILQKRFTCKGKLNGHSIGNILLSSLSQYVGSFPDGVRALGEVLNIKGTVLPVTLNRATLVAELTDNSFLFGEATIDVPSEGRREKIKHTFLVPHHSDHVTVYPPVVEAIKSADLIIIGHGDLFMSVIPNFLVPGVKEAMIESSAQVLCVMNIMTKFGETDNFNVADFVKTIENFSGRKIDLILANFAKPDKATLEEYKKQKAKFIESSKGAIERKTIVKDLLDVSGGVIRHSPEKLKEALKEIIRK